MTPSDRAPSGGAAALAMLELIFHSTVRSIRRGHSNAMVGLLLNILQTVIMIVAFYLTMELLGMRAVAIRGDFVLYLMTGIFLFMTHTKAMGAVAGSEGPASAMMLHGPMNTIVAICSSALGALYMQVLSILVILFVYHSAFVPVEIEDPVGAFGMVLLAWFSGVAVGMVFLAATPWWPTGIGLVKTIYARANMIFSGKMFVANTLTFTMLNMFDWNPLFHIIDQARGHTFINYSPHYTSVSYAVYVSLTLIIIGLLGEFYTRRHVSASWTAGR